MEHREAVTARRYAADTASDVLGCSCEFITCDDMMEGPLASGYFVPPTVFVDVRNDMRIAQEEIFGPVISAIPFTDIEEVIHLANATQFGLGSGVWTRDVSKAHRLAKAIRAGSVWVNCY